MSDAIIGIDVARPPYDQSDFSALSMMCCNCKTVIHTELFVGEIPSNERPKVCNKCGVVFSRFVTYK